MHLASTRDAITTAGSDESNIREIAAIATRISKRLSFVTKGSVHEEVHRSEIVANDISCCCLTFFFLSFFAGH
jgi:hypothetical protein